MKKIVIHIIKVISKCSFFRWDHLAVCVLLGIVGWLLVLIISKISIFDPVKAAFDDFSITDVFFEVQRNGHSVKNNDIIIVDMTDLKTRKEIAQAITDIKNCHPKVLGIDLLFERPSFDAIEDDSLISAIDGGDCPQVLSCKLRDYDNQNDVFKNCLYSFFYGIDRFNWGYANYSQKRLGGVARKTSQMQKLNDSIVYSFPYMLSCYYTGKQPKQELVNEREIIYANVEFFTLKSTEVLKHKALLKDKLVLLGTINEEADMHFSPIGKIPGVLMIAYSILSYMNHYEIVRMSKWSSMLLTFVLCLLAAWMGYMIEKWNSVFFPILTKIFNFVLGATLVGVALYMFVSHNYYIDLLYPLLGLAMMEDVRELYAGIIRWAVRKKKISIIRNSVYAEI